MTLPEDQILQASTLFPVLGVPSSLTYACCALVQILADAELGGHALVRAVYLAEAQAAWSGFDPAAPKPVVLFSDCPSLPLVNQVLAARRPFIVVVDHFEEVVHQLVDSRNMDLIEVLRVTTQSFCAVGACRDERALVLAPTDAALPLGDVLSRIAAHLRFPNPAEAAARTLAALGYPAETDQTFLGHVASSGSPARPAQTTSARIDAEGQVLISAIAPQYDAIANGRGATRIEWPTAVWLDADHPGELLQRPVEMTGPARYVIYGPYFHLPNGPWEAEVIIEIAGNLSGNRLSVDVFSIDVLGGVVTPLPVEGVYSFSFPIEIVDSFRPVELRFQLMEGAIEGRMALRAVAFSRKSPDGSGDAPVALPAGEGSAGAATGAAAA